MVDRVAFGGAADALAAVDAAARAFPGWAGTPAHQRGEVLERAAAWIRARADAAVPLPVLDAPVGCGRVPSGEPRRRLNDARGLGGR
ncbi:MAG: aldehyde dehydrogenase family protein, partial [Trueperaceae bacterium]|nr:aldehyde dehydrogenase family protein [Trueperaceae bacterium]